MAGILPLHLLCVGLGGVFQMNFLLICLWSTCLTSLDRLAPRTSLGSVVPPISLRSSHVKTLALSSSSKLPMLSLSMVALDAALQETMFFMSLS